MHRCYYIIEYVKLSFLSNFSGPFYHREASAFITFPHSK